MYSFCLCYSDPAYKKQTDIIHGMRTGQTVYFVQKGGKINYLTTNHASVMWSDY